MQTIAPKTWRIKEESIWNHLYLKLSDINNLDLYGQYSRMTPRKDWDAWQGSSADRARNN